MNKNLKQNTYIAEFQSKINVSRETLNRLEIYADLLVKWQKKINLVSNSTLEEMWIRHFLDSAQIYNMIENKKAKIIDLGSGAGFPSLVLSVMGMTDVHLIESDSRKCAFMREVKRQTGCNAVIHNERIEKFTAENIDYITCRAYASLDKILKTAFHLMKKDTKMILLKGKNYQLELEEAKKEWTINTEIIKSFTDGNSVILKLQDIRKCTTLNK